MQCTVTIATQFEYHRAVMNKISLYSFPIVAHNLNGALFASYNVFQSFCPFLHEGTIASTLTNENVIKELALRHLESLCVADVIKLNCCAIFAQVFRFCFRSQKQIHFSSL